MLGLTVNLPIEPEFEYCCSPFHVWVMVPVALYENSIVCPTFKGDEDCTVKPTVFPLFSWNVTSGSFRPAFWKEALIAVSKAER